MKHNLMIDNLKLKLGDKFSLVTKIIKSNSSGTNYLSIKFSTEEDRNEVKELLKGYHDGPTSCMPRYGIGLIVTAHYIMHL